MNMVLWISYLLAAFMVGFFARKISRTVARLMSGNYSDG